ncbi:MAG: thioredoxin [Lachnospiraceae bacterium]|nr:thioredoxin [Lachnospiraceae bacterium]
MAVVKITADNFEEEVMKSEVPVLVDFWAVWCGPCQMQGPVVDEAAEEFAGKVKVGKLNVDEEGTLAQKYNVMSIPTLILFQNGQAVKKEMGFHSLEEIRAMLP